MYIISEPYRFSDYSKGKITVKKHKNLSAMAVFTRV